MEAAILPIKGREKKAVDQLRVQWLHPVGTAQERHEIKCDGDYRQDSLQYASLPLDAAKYDTQVLKYQVKMCHCHLTHRSTFAGTHTHSHYVFMTASI